MPVRDDPDVGARFYLNTSPLWGDYAYTLYLLADPEDQGPLLASLRVAEGTRDDGRDAARQRLALHILATRVLPDWLDVAGLGAHAQTLRSGATPAVDAVRAAGDAACEAYTGRRAEMLTTIGRGLPAPERLGGAQGAVDTPPVARRMCGAWIEALATAAGAPEHAGRIFTAAVTAVAAGVAHSSVAVGGGPADERFDAAYRAARARVERALTQAVGDLAATHRRILLDAVPDLARGR